MRGGGEPGTCLGNRCVKYSLVLFLFEFYLVLISSVVTVVAHQRFDQGWVARIGKCPVTASPATLGKGESFRNISAVSRVLVSKQFRIFLPKISRCLNLKQQWLSLIQQPASQTLSLWNKTLGLATAADESISPHLRWNKVRCLQLQRWGVLAGDASGGKGEQRPRAGLRWGRARWGVPT